MDGITVLQGVVDITAITESFEFSLNIGQYSLIALSVPWHLGEDEGSGSHYLLPNGREIFKGHKELD